MCEGRILLAAALPDDLSAKELGFCGCGGIDLRKCRCRPFELAVTLTAYVRQRPPESEQQIWVVGFRRIEDSCSLVELESCAGCAEGPRPVTRLA